MKRIISLLACLPFLICGCGSKSTTTVNIVNVQFKDITAFETTATFTLRFSNEKPEPVRLTGGVHKIYMNGLYVGKGLSSEALELPRLGTAMQDVTVHLSNIALATRLKPIIESQSFDYRVQSTLYGKSWFNRMHSVSEGRLDLKDFTPTPSPEKETNSLATPPQQPPPVAQ
jgi:LEA14-like dessication related protein